MNDKVAYIEVTTYDRHGNILDAISYDKKVIDHCHYHYDEHNNLIKCSRYDSKSGMKITFE